MSTTAGLFADAAAADLPPDDALKGPLLDVAQPEKAKEKPAVEKTVEKTTEKPAEKTTEEKTKAEAEAKAAADKSKEATTEELSNPNLTAEEKKKETAAAEDDEKKPEGMTEKAFISWKKKNAEVKASKAEAEAAKAELATFKAKLEEAGKTTAELESLKKELATARQKLDDYEGEISVVRIEGTQKYKDTVSTPQATIRSDMEEMAKRYEIEPETLLRAIAEPDKAKRADLLEETLSDFKAVDREEVVQSAREWQRLQKTATDMRADAAKHLERITQETKAQQDEQAATITRDYREAVVSQWDQALQSIPEIRKVDGQDKWNAYLDSVRGKIEALDANELPVEEVAKMAVSHHVLPEVRTIAKHYKTLAETKAAEVATEKERADKAEAKLAEYLKTAPGAGAGRAGDAKGGTRSSSGLFADSVLAEG